MSKDFYTFEISWISGESVACPTPEFLSAINNNKPFGKWNPGDWLPDANSNASHCSQIKLIGVTSPLIRIAHKVLLTLMNCTIEHCCVADSDCLEIQSGSFVDTISVCHLRNPIAGEYLRLNVLVKHN